MFRGRFHSQVKQHCKLKQQRCALKYSKNSFVAKQYTLNYKKVSRRTHTYRCEHCVIISEDQFLVLCENFWKKSGPSQLSVVRVITEESETMTTHPCALQQGHVSNILSHCFRHTHTCHHTPRNET